MTKKCLNTDTKPSPLIDANAYIKTTHILRRAATALNIKTTCLFYNTWHIGGFHKMWRILGFLDTAEHYTMIHGNWCLLLLGCDMIKKQIQRQKILRYACINN